MAHDAFLIDALKREDQTGTKQMEQQMADFLTGQKEAFGYEAAFVVSDASKLYYSYAGLNKKIEEVCNALDILVKDNDGMVWTTPVVEKYDALIDELDDLNSRLNRLCVIEYPNGAHVYHYSYCV